jgi:hypothetical protein
MFDFFGGAAQSFLSKKKLKEKDYYIEKMKEMIEREIKTR